jgi:hypothetical protein
MKKLWLLGTICLLSVVTLFIFGKSLIRTPKLKISGDFWGFGTVKNIKSIKHTFIIQNLGNAELTLTAWPSCHKCINPILTATRIPPKDKAKLIVELYIVKDGLNEAYVMIETNDSKQRAKKVMLKALAVR